MATKTRKRDGILRSLSVSKLRSQDSYLSYPGILPVDFPEETTILLIPDAHIPAHYRRLFWPLKRFAHKLQPDILGSIGDWCDTFAISRHEPALRSKRNFQMELDESRREWDDLMDYSGAAWGFMIIGNHEDRIYRFLQDNAPAFGSLVTPHNREPLNFHNLMGYDADDNTTFLYGVEDRGGFEGGMIINGDFNLHHGIVIRPAPGASPLADMDRWHWSTGHGHTHRAGFVARETLNRTLRGYEFGHLVDMDHAYMAYAKKMFPNWAPGFAVLKIFNGTVHCQPIPIQPIKCADGKVRLSFVYQGEVYSESDR